MEGAMIAFFVLAALTLLGTMMMLSSVRVVHMIFSMALVFLAIAGLYILLGADFVGIVQIVVYVGAITVLAVFGIMLTRHDARETSAERSRTNRWLSFATAVLLFIVLFVAITQTHFFSLGDTGQDELPGIREIGMLFMGPHVYTFELASVLLLSAFIGAIVMAKGDGEDE